MKALLPQLPITPLRKVFSWHQADGRYSVNNRFPAFTVEAQDGTHYYGFPADNDGLKVGKHDGGQPMAAPSSVNPSVATPATVPKFSPSCGSFAGCRRMFTRRSLQL